jgi:hypothetical protein
MASIDFSPPVGPVARELDQDVGCRKCKYNLRGLAGTSSCPECGTPVEFSTRGDLLHFSDPAWVSDLQTGIWCILLGIIMIVMGVVAGMLIRMQNIRVDLSVAATIFSAGAAILHFYGAWLLTAPDPSGLGEDRYGTSRKLIRITLMFGILHHVVALLTMSHALSPNVHALTVAVGWVALLASVAGIFAMLNYLGKLARRIPDEDLAVRAERLVVAFAIPLSIMAFFGLIAFASDGEFASIMMLFGCVVVLCLLAFLVIGSWYLAFLANLAGAFAIQVEIAEQAWKPRRLKL